MLVSRVHGARVCVSVLRGKRSWGSFLLLALIDLYTLDFPICSRVSRLGSELHRMKRNQRRETHAQASENDAPFCWTNWSHVATPVR